MSAKVIMKIYKSQDGKEKSLALYDKQLSKLNMAFSDIYVSTSFGRTHLVEIGNKAAMPTNVEKKRLRDYRSPTLIIASEKDCLFPARKVLRRAKKIISDCQTVELEGRGHMHILPQTEKERIVAFLRKD